MQKIFLNIFEIEINEKTRNRTKHCQLSKHQFITKKSFNESSISSSTLTHFQSFFSSKIYLFYPHNIVIVCLSKRLSLFFNFLCVRLRTCHPSHFVFMNFLSFCLSVSLSFCLSVFLYLCLYSFMSFCIYVFILLCLYVFMSLCLFVFLSFCLSVFLSFCLSVFLSLCLSVCRNALRGAPNTTLQTEAHVVRHKKGQINTF